MSDSLLDRLPGGRIIAKDLSIASSVVPGNPFCRYDTENEQRKYCSKSLWNDADEKYVIPEGGSIPRKHVECEVCENDSYRTDDDACGRCGTPIFDCPNDCGAVVHGEAEKCHNCDAPYSW